MNGGWPREVGIDMKRNVTWVGEGGERKEQAAWVQIHVPSLSRSRLNSSCLAPHLERGMLKSYSVRL